MPVYAIAALVGIGNTNVLVDHDILNKVKTLLTRQLHISPTVMRHFS